MLAILNADTIAEDTASPIIFKSLKLSYRSADRKASLQLPGLSTDNVSLHLDNTRCYKHGLAMTLTLNCQPTEQFLELLDFYLELQPGLSRECRMMANGFQSWSRSEEMGANERIAPLSFPARPLLASYGDRNIYSSSGKRGRHHSWTYTYFRYPDNQTLLIGSLSENNGYTLFEYDYNGDRLLIRKDCAGASVLSGYQLLNLYIGWGELDLLFKEYFSLIGSTRKPAPKAAGWCSWYNYYTAVSEDIVRQNLSVLTESRLSINYFQIDDGWQKEIGDWLECNEKFPSGMQAVCEEIKTHQFRPGLWLAPLICVRSSEIFRNKPEWLLRNHRGKPIRAGFNPGWEGFFYALDFYAPGFQDYLRRVFNTLQSEWGYRMLKLDFLYAAALVPQGGRSRGQIMTEVIDFLDQQTRNSMVLGCGVPLGPAFGKMDYCRIGSDVGPYWKDYLKLINYPERVSTENSLASTIGRRHLDRNAFRNDPDVFILRYGIAGINENRLSNNQRYTLFFLNNLLGGLVFFSDDLDNLTAEQMQMMRRSFPIREIEMTGLDNDNGLHHLEFMVGEKAYLAIVNLTGSPRTVKMPGAFYYHPEYFILQPGSVLNLEPYQSVCFYRIEPGREAINLLGATGHIFPGAQIDDLVFAGDAAHLKLHDHASPETEIILGLPAGRKGCSVNGVFYPVFQKKGYNYITVPYRQEKR